MTKREFVYALRCRLNDLPVPETEPYIEYYIEMIDDRIDEGMTEEEAVADVGTPEEIEHRIRIQYANDGHSSRQGEGFFARMRRKLHLDRPLEGWQAVVLVVAILLFFPLMGMVIGLVFGALGLIVGMFFTAFGVVVACYATTVGLFAGGIGLLVTGIIRLAQHLTGEGLFLLGGGFLLIGLSALALWGVVALTRLILKGLRKLLERLSSRRQGRRRMA